MVVRAFCPSRCSAVVRVTVARWPLCVTALLVQDVTFHQCVNLGKFNTEKVVSFVPPDGEFALMQYR